MALSDRKPVKKKKEIKTSEDERSNQPSPVARMLHEPYSAANSP